MNRSGPMNLEEFRKPGGRDAFPTWAAALLVGAIFLGLIALLGYSFYARQTQGEAVMRDWRRLTPEQVRRIVVQPLIGEGRNSGRSIDPQSLAKTDKAITDEDAIRAVIEAIRASNPAPSFGRDDTAKWRCGLVVEVAGHSLQCKATSTDNHGVLLEFWSKGLTGWALGTLRADALADGLPKAAGLKPPED